MSRTDGIIFIPVGAFFGLCAGKIQRFIRVMFPSIISDFYVIGIILFACSHIEINNFFHNLNFVMFFIPFVYFLNFGGWAFSTPLFSKIFGTEEWKYIGEDTKDEVRSKWNFLYFILAIYIISII